MGVADMLNGLSDIINGKRTENTPAAAPIPKIPDQLIGAPGVLQVPVLGSEWARQALVQLPQIPETLASFGTDIYGLLNAGAKWATGSENDVLPGAETAGKISDEVHTTGRNVSDWILDEPRNTHLLEGTPPELAANWAGLGVQAVMRAPSAITSKIDEGIKLLEAGKGLAARTAEYTAKGLEMITPVMVRTPTKAIEAGSIGFSGAIGTGMELAFPDPDISKANDTVAKATDVAMTGGTQADQGTKEAIAVVNPAVASMLPTTGNQTLDTVLGYSAGAAAIFAGYKTGAAGRLIKMMSKHGDETNLDAADLLRRQVVDKTVPMKESYASVLESQNHPRADELSKAMSNKIDEATGAAQDTKMASFFDYGEMQGSAIKSPPPKDFYTKLSQLAPDKQEAISRAIRSRSEYHDMEAGAQRGAAARNADWQAATRDPEIMAAVREYDTITRKLADFQLEQRDISPQQHRQMVSDNSLSFPAQLSRAGMDSKSPNFSRSVQSINGGDPIKDLPNHIQQVIRRAASNNVQRTLINAFRAAEDAGDAVAKGFMGRRNMMRVNDPNAQIVYYRDHLGLVRSQEFTDPYLFKAMNTHGDMSRLHALAGASPIWSGMARGLQQGATGAAAAAVGQPFAHIAALYNAMFGAITREKGTAAGPVDAALQRAGLVGLRGDPTLIPHSILKSIEGIAGVMAKRASDSLHNHAVKEAGFAGTMNPTAATKMADDLRKFYEKTWVHSFQQEGLLGPATYGGIDPDKSISTTVARMRSQSVPVQVIRDTYHFLNDILHAVAASPGAAVYANNKHLRPELQARAVRELTGDTGRAGAYEGKAAQTVGNVGIATPWWNVYVQSTDKFLRSISTPQKALSTAIGATTMIGLPTISVGVWTAGMGQEYTDYKYNKRSPDKMAANLYIPIPGLAPEDGLEIPIDPLMRAYHYAVEVMTGHALGLFTGEIHKPENESQKAAFAEMARNRWLLGGAVSHSIFDQAVVPPVPPAAAAGLALAGVNWKSYTDTNEIHKRNDNGYTTSDARNPFREVLGLHESAVAENVIRALGGGAAQTAADVFMTGAQILNEGGGVDKVLKRGGQIVQLASQDRFQKLGIMDGFAAISPSQEAAGKLVSDKVAVMKQMTKAMEATNKGAASGRGDIIGNKQRGYQEALGGSIAIPADDKLMDTFSYYASKKLQMIQKEFLGPNNDDYVQRSSLQISTKYSPEHKREMMNELSEKIIQRNRMALTQIQQFEAQMSHLFKVPVQLEKLNLNKGMDQFKAQ